MPTWRDTWQDTPGVAVVAETALTEQGTVEDALLFVLDATPARVLLTDEHGTARRFTLPEQALGGDYTAAGLDFHTEEPT